MKTYLVGGAVRDRLLGIEAHERDWVVVGSTPEEMVRLGYRPVGRGFPVFLHPDTGEEYALARTERKTAPGYHGFTFHAAPEVTLEEDLGRRDLTINAMAEDADGNVIDLYDGRQDLQLGRLRHVSPAFAEDPVRILRCARFAARFAPYGFRVAHATGRLMRDMVANGEVDALVPERVWAEFERALNERVPERFIEVLHRCGALSRLAPEIERLLGEPSSAHSPKQSVPALIDLHRAAELGAAGPVRFAALMHTAGTEEVQSLCQRLHAPNAYRELAILSAGHLRECQQSALATAESLLALFEHCDAFRRQERFQLLLKVCEAAAIPYSADHLLRALHAAKNIDTALFVAKGLRGPEIGVAVRAARIASIQSAL